MKIERLELSLLTLPLVHFFETSFGRIFEKRCIIVGVDGEGVTRHGECVAEQDPYCSSETNETAIRLHDVCAAHGIPVRLGGMLESGVGRAANIHRSTLPNFTLRGDVAASKRRFNPDLIGPPIEGAGDGTMAVSTGCGLGVSIRSARVEAATTQRAAFDVSSFKVRSR